MSAPVSNSANYSFGPTVIAIQNLKITYSRLANNTSHSLKTPRTKQGEQ